MLITLIIWFVSGSVTVILLILSAFIGRRQEYIHRHKLLLTIAFCSGLLGWLIVLIIVCIGYVLVYVGNSGGFQRR